MRKWLKGLSLLILVCLLVSLASVIVAASGETETVPTVVPQSILTLSDTPGGGTAPVGLAQLQGQNRIIGHVYAAFSYDFWNLPNGASTMNNNALHITLNNVSGSIPISWSGTSFSGSFSDTKYRISISGSVSNDGATLNSLTYTREYLYEGTEFTTEESARIVLGGQFPIWGTDGKPSNRVTGSEAAKYVSSLSHTSTTTRDGQKTETWEYQSADWSVPANCGVTLTFSYEYVPGSTTTTASTTSKTTTTTKPATSSSTPTTRTTTASTTVKTTLSTTSNSAYEPKISGINGQAMFLAPGATEWDFCDLDTDLPPGTRIRTGIDSTCVLSFGDMSTFILKPESEVIVSEKPDGKSVKTFKGDVWANFKKMVTDGTMDVEMQQAVASIKGTTFICEERQGTSTVKVIEGTVQVKEKNSSSYVILQDGEFATTSMTTGIGNIKEFDAVGEAAIWNGIRAEMESAGDDTSSVSGIFSSIPTKYIAIGAGVIVLLIVIGVARRKK